MNKKLKCFLVARRDALMRQNVLMKKQNKTKSHLNWKKCENWFGQRKLDFTVLVNYACRLCHTCPFSSKNLILLELLLFLGFHLVFLSHLGVVG